MRPERSTLPKKVREDGKYKGRCSGNVLDGGGEPRQRVTKDASLRMNGKPRGRIRGRGKESLRENYRDEPS